MKKMMLFVLGAVLALAAPYAHADGMNQISFQGSVTYSPNGKVMFGPQSTTSGNATVGGTSTGVFAPFLALVTSPCCTLNTIVNFNNFRTDNAGSFVLFNATAPDGETLSFTVTSQSTTDLGAGSPTDSGAGFYTLVDNGVTTIINNGTFTMTTQGAANTNVTFSDTNSITPEPSSLLLLGTGLVSAAGMLVRRRRLIA